MADRVFKRKIYDKMLQWKQDQHGTTALLIRGARRIGKSTIAEQFAKQEYKSYIKIDFAKASKDIVQLFEDINNLDLFFTHLQAYCQKTLYLRKSVIILDDLANYELTWEKGKLLNLGIDFSIFKRRLDFVVDYCKERL